VNEQQEQLAFSRVDGAETDHVPFVDGDKQDVRGRLVSHGLAPPDPK
jgi:hypothetical protein